MNPERIRLLEQYAREDPNDPFPIYGLALEWVNHDARKAKELFDKLLTEHPDYIPVYYHAGQFYLAEGDLSKGIGILETGIQKTKAAGDLKALAELKSLTDGFDPEG